MARSYWYKDIQNPVTGQRLRITAADKSSLANKINRQYARWEREQIQAEKSKTKQLALDKTVAALEDISALRNILRDTLQVDDKIDWHSMLDTAPYPGEEPKKEQFMHGSFSKSLSFIGAFKKRAVEQTTKEDAQYEQAHKEYVDKKSEWEAAQKEHNNSLARKKIAYEEGDEQGVEDYIDLVFDKSRYPDVININSEALFSAVTKTLLVELDLPGKEDIPDVTEWRYVSSTDTIEIRSMKDKVFAQFFDTVQYQIVLRILHEVFEADYKEHIQAVVVNGNMDVTDKATGKVAKKSILSIQAQREEFLSVDLKNVEPAACFRHFKGITAGALVELSPVKPILRLNRKDKRIVEAANVLDEFNPAQNLATMEWEKFEVLIRDLFKREFSGEGVTVEVTRASRDAGVDGIAFDEDPIRGGKFVIQAKRYNNLVPVSAVRDLYGTVLNEGAVKGILVTTSYYGPDAISFAKDKPLTLINGEELLYMFKKHGDDFKIQLQRQKRASQRLV